MSAPRDEGTPPDRPRAGSRPAGPAPGGLVAVHAHPDDETLATGALLATWAVAGLPVTVVTATRGERGEVIPPRLAHLEGDGPALAAHRERELAAALAALGVADHVFLDTLPPGAPGLPLGAPGLPPGAPGPSSSHAPVPDAGPSSSGIPPSDPAASGTGDAHVTDGATHPPHESLLSPMRRDRTVAAERNPSRRERPGRYEDSGMVWVGAGRAGAVAGDVPAAAFVAVPLDEAAGRLAGLLRARRPAVVVTYDPEGGYGHPDHVRTHEVTTRAVALASAEGWTPTVLWRRTGRAALTEGYRALARGPVRAALSRPVGHVPGGADDLALPDPAGPLPAVAVPDGELDLAVDVLAVRDRVLAALAAHATQVQAVRAVDGERALVGCYALSNRVLAPLLPDECYVRAAGPDPAPPPGVRRLP